MTPSFSTSPLIFILISLASFVFFVLSGKALVLQSSIFVLIFFRFLLMAILDLLFNVKKLKPSLKISHFSIHIILSLANLAFYFCFFGSLSSLALFSAIAIYLSYPLFVPFILRAWMGRKFKWYLAFGIYLGFLGIIFTFNTQYKLNNMLVLVALLGAFLKAITFTGYHRLNIGESFISTWVIKYFGAILASTILLMPSFQLPEVRFLLLLLINCLFEKISLYAFKKSLNRHNQLNMMMLFNSSLFLLAGLDFLIFHQKIFLKPFLSATLIYFGLFFAFKQKNVLPNSIYDL